MRLNAIMPSTVPGGSKVYELLASGVLPSIKIDRTRLVRKADLRAYVESPPPSVDAVILGPRPRPMLGASQRLRRVQPRYI